MGGCCFRPVLLSSSALFIFIPKNHPVFTVVQNDLRTTGRRVDTKSARRCAWHTRSARKKRKRNRRHVVSSSRGREGRATRRDASTKDDDDDDGTHWNNNNNVIENNNQKTFYFCFVVAVVVVCAKNARSEEDGRKCDGSQKIF